MQMTAGEISWPKERSKQLVLFAIGLVGLILVYFGSKYLWFAVDWHYFFRPAALKLLQGQSPYQVTGFLNPPWALIPLIPFAILPEQIGQAFLVAVVMVVVFYAGYRFGGRRLALVVLLVSPPVIALIHYGNIDWMVVLGLVLPPQIGLLFVTTKPQVGVFVALVWLLEAWTNGGWRTVARIFGPLVLATLVSFLLYGFWPIHLLEYRSFETFKIMNYSLWPYSILLGLVLLYLGLKYRQKEFAIAASPCLSPYLMMHSWIGAFLAIIRYERLFIGVVLCVWAYLLF